MKNKQLITLATIILNCGYFLSLGQNLNVELTANKTLDSSLANTQTNLSSKNNLTPPAESKILCATVISDKSTYLIWEPSKANNFASYNIYRQDALTGNYILVKTISDISVSNFSDDSLNTLVNSYCYKVQTINTCGNSISLNSLQEHCTINATADRIKGGVQVNWNPYVGASVDTYSVYRVELNNTVPVLVTKVPSNVLTIMDTTMSLPCGFSYRIKANKLNGHFISSSSDTSMTRPILDVSKKSQINILRSTILNNNAVLTKWETPIASVEPIEEYYIYKSNDNVNFSFLAAVPSIEHHYTDNDTDGSSENCYYNIEAKDAYGATTKGGSENTSLLLKAKLVDGNIQLNWTKYVSSNKGVDYSINENMRKNESLGSIEKTEEDNPFR